MLAFLRSVLGGTGVAAHPNYNPNTRTLTRT